MNMKWMRSGAVVVACACAMALGAAQGNSPKSHGRHDNGLHRGWYKHDGSYWTTREVIEPRWDTRPVYVWIVLGGRRLYVRRDSPEYRLYIRRRTPAYRVYVQRPSPVYRVYRESYPSRRWVELNRSRAQRLAALRRRQRAEVVIAAHRRDDYRRRWRDR